MKNLLAILLVFSCTSAYTAESDSPLPSPLDLKTALSFAGDYQYPEIQIALSEIQLLQSERRLVDSKNNFKLSAFGQLATTIPSSLLPDDYPGRSTDHELSLNLNKRLYDFGRTENQQDAFDKLFLSANINLNAQQQSHYLQIMSAFFNVILADLEFSYSNEAMSIVYIQFDRAKIHHSQKKISDLELLRIENNYNIIAIDRAKSENEQRITRSILATLLNKPDQLPADLDIPDMSVIPDFSVKRKDIEIKFLKEKVFSNNLELKKLSLQIDAEKNLKQSYYADKYPIIRGELGTTWYSRELGGDDKAVAAVSVEIPLYQGGEVDARVLGSQAKLNKLYATQAKLKMQLNQQLLERWMELKNLKQSYKQILVELSYRELYLDKSRIEYDSELKSDLGSAMVYLSQAQLAEKKVLFKIALLWTELDIMMGNNNLYGMQL